MAVHITQKAITVTASGTAVQVDAALKVPAIIITANPSNSGTIFVGDVNVSASDGLGQPLASNESFVLEPPQQYGTDEVVDLSKIYIDATVSGDKVNVAWYVRE